MQYILDVPMDQDWRVLQPILEHLKIRFSPVAQAKNVDTTAAPSFEEVRKLAFIKLYEIGKISSSRAAEELGMARVDFLELLGQYQVAFFGQASASELELDFENA